METFTISKKMSNHIETLLCDVPPARILKLLRTIYFDHLYRQQENGMSVNFDKEVLIMDAIFGFFEIAEEETSQSGGGDGNTGYKLN
jgi:hypothetical protein